MLRNINVFEGSLAINVMKSEGVVCNFCYEIYGVKVKH